MKKTFALVAILLSLSGCTGTPNGTSNPNPGNGNPQTGATTSPTTGNADTLKVQALITQKCAYCHSINPNSASGYNGPADGIALDTYEQMVSRARQIKREVSGGQMPQQPITMTAEERNMINQWSGS